MMYIDTCHLQRRYRLSLPFTEGCVVLIRACLSGCPGECHPPTRDPGDDTQVHDGPNPDLSQAVSVSVGGATLACQSSLLSDSHPPPTQ